MIKLVPKEDKGNHILSLFSQVLSLFSSIRAKYYNDHVFKKLQRPSTFSVQIFGCFWNIQISPSNIVATSQLSIFKFKYRLNQIKTSSSVILVTFQMFSNDMWLIQPIQNIFTITEKQIRQHYCFYFLVIWSFFKICTCLPNVYYFTALR